MHNNNCASWFVKHMHTCFTVFTLEKAVLPSAWFVVWQLGEVVVYCRRLVMKIKEPTNNYITILEQTPAARCTPSSTSHSLNHLQPHPEPPLPARKPHNEHQQGRGVPPSKEPGEPRHGWRYSRH